MKLGKFAIVLGTLAFVLGIQSVFAAKPLVAEAPISEVGDASCTSISVSAWTELVGTETKGRVGLFVVNKSTNAVYGGFDSADSTSTTPLLFPAGSTTYLGVSDALTLYLVATNDSSAINACYVEVKQ